MSTRLHRQLAAHYAGDGGLTEVKVARFVVDAVAGGRFIEVQLGAFFHLRRKLERLCELGPVLLVFPVAYEKTVVKLEPDGDAERSRRRSPKRGSTLALIPELPAVAHLIPHENFELEIALTRENEYRRDQRRRWGRGYEVVDRELLGIEQTVRFSRPRDLLRLLPRRLKEPFTNKHLARRMDQPVWLVQRLTSSLRKAGALEPAGRTAEGIQYVTAGADG